MSFLDQVEKRTCKQMKKVHILGVFACNRTLSLEAKQSVKQIKALKKGVLNVKNVEVQDQISTLQGNFW